MVGNDKSNIILMVQSAHRLFCYFNVSPMRVKEFEDRYGENSWKNSKPVIKVYFVESGIAKEIKTIFIDDFSNNLYIDMDRGDQDVFVKLGRILQDSTFIAFQASNIVNTPRNYESCDTALYFLDVSQNVNLNSQSVLPTCGECTNNHREPKPYLFMSEKNIYSKYPKIIIGAGYYQNDFFIKHFEELKNKFNLNSSESK